MHDITRIVLGIIGYLFCLPEGSVHRPPLTVHACLIYSAVHQLGGFLWTVLLISCGSSGSIVDLLFAVGLVSRT